jgi:hypothetical protein
MSCGEVRQQAEELGGSELAIELRFGETPDLTLRARVELADTGLGHEHAVLRGCSAWSREQTQAAVDATKYTAAGAWG